MVPGACMKYNGQQQIRRSCSNEEHFHINVCIKNTVFHRDISREKAQRQHTPGHTAGYCKQHKCQPDEMLSPRKSHRGKQNPHNDFIGPVCKKTTSRKKNCHRVCSSQHCRKKTSKAVWRNSRKSGRRKKDQIIHQRVEHKYTVHVNNCHRSASSVRTHIIGQQD